MNQTAGSFVRRALGRLRPDPYILALLGMVVLASLLPARGEAAVGLGWATKLAIALLFFLHGAKLSREAVIAGIAHWRLHLTVLASTFVLFPILGLGVMLLPETILPRQLALGVLFLCCLPSTVQSSIAFTAIARGNVAAAVCAASASNLFGIALTPLLAAMLMGTQGGFAPSAVEGVVVQLLAPFVAGQVARPWVGRWVDKHKRLTGLVDRGSILLVVYTAFSEAVVGGLWRKVDLVEIVILLIVCAALLAVVLAVTAYGSRLMGFDKEDEITIVFCGSKKSLASGVPLAGILFPGAAAGVMVLPLMLFHQIQLMACAVIAQRYAARAKAG
ncbi:bile acid:sodium symporter family protein [Caulobacter sp. CCUG 60055]